jgi:hypothetical protein
MDLQVNVTSQEKVTTDKLLLNNVNAEGYLEGTLEVLAGESLWIKEIT